MSKFTPSSRKNPCPVCDRTKDGDCRIADLGDLIFCHSHQTSEKGEEINGYRFIRQSPEGAGWGIWSRSKAKRKVRKAVEPESIYYYPARDGSPLIRVHRRKGSTPEFWQSYYIDGQWLTASKVDDDVKSDMRKSVPIYRYREVRDAIGKGQTIFWVEGEKCADALWKIGLAATTSIGGCKAFERWGEYEDDLEGAILVICPDRDKPGLEYADKVAELFPYASWLYPFPESKSWQHPPETDGADIADWIADYQLGPAEILAAITEDRKHQTEKLNKVQSFFSNFEENSQQSTNQVEELPRLVREYRLVETLLGNRLAFNAMTQQVELDGESLELDRIKLDLAVEYGLHLKSSREDVTDIITKLADKQKYNPVERYLTRVAEEHGTDTSILDNLAERYFGQSANIYQVFLRKTLIAAAARAMNPGCKVDTALILQGKQGYKKSTFFKTLASAEWFDDSFGEQTDKDERLKLVGAWWIEWAELEAVFKRRERASVKAFLTSSEDKVRPPYGRSTKTFKRHCIICGSTNENEFLSDPTGHRRYWVIPVSRQIDTATLLLERDRIWAAAVAAYRNGEEWWLTEEEGRVAEAIAREFQTTDPWQDAIEKYLESRDEVTISEILDQVIQLELGRQDRATQLRAGDTLRQLGWQKGNRRVAGRQRRVWLRPSDFRGAENGDATLDAHLFVEKRDIENLSEQSEESLLLSKEEYQGYHRQQLEESNGKSSVSASKTATLPATLPPPNEQRRVAPSEVMPQYLYPVIGRIEAALWAETPAQQRMQLKQIAKEEGQRYKEALPFLSEEELEQISKLRGEG